MATRCATTIKTFDSAKQPANLLSSDSNQVKFTHTAKKAMCVFVPGGSSVQTFYQNGNDSYLPSQFSITSNGTEHTFQNPTVDSNGKKANYTSSDGLYTATVQTKIIS